jgi:hypothetical protein
LFVGCALAALSATSNARGGSFSYSVDVSSSIQLMEAPFNASAQLQVSQQTGIVDRMAANNPVMRITNTSTGDTINSMTLTLNDPESVIEALKMLTPNGTPTGAFATNEFAGPSTSINITFPTPLAPGQSVMWAMELAPVNGYTNVGWTPGYENILFPTNNPIPGTNASVTMTYTLPSGGDPTVTNVLPDLVAFDPMVTVDPSTTCSNSGSAQSLFTVGITEPPTPTPEPGSIVVMLLAALPLGAWAWHKRRRAMPPAVLAA